MKPPRFIGHARRDRRSAPANEQASRRRLFLAFLLSYCSILLVPLLFGGIAYVRLVRDLQSQVVDDVQAALEHRISLLEQRLREVDSLVTQLALNSRVNGFLNANSPMTDSAALWQLIELQASLTPYRLTSEFVSTFYVGYERNGVVISPIYSFISQPFFYGIFFQYGEMAASDWNTTVYGTSHNRRVLPAAPVKFYDHVER